jgi:O-antigen/teichoic acid export membrane protein
MPPRVSAHLARLRQTARSKLVLNVGITTVNFTTQLFVQMGLFVLLTRTLGPAGYGTFASLTALTLLASSFVGWGGDQIMVQHVAADAEAFPRFFGNALLHIFITAPVFMAVSAAILESMSFGTLGGRGIVAVVVADLFFGRLTWLCVMCYLAFERASQQFIINIGTSLLRLLAMAGAIAVTPQLSLEDWAVWYCASAALGAVLALAMTIRQLGRPHWEIVRGKLALGFQYCIEFAANLGMRDADKPLVTEIAGAAVGGTYTAAFRLVEVASIPVRAITYAVVARYFRHAKSGTHSGIAFGKRLLPFVACYAVLAGLGLFIGADWVPMILGPAYAATPFYIRVLAAFPLLSGVSTIGFDMLRATERQRLRSAIVLVSSFGTIPVIWLATLHSGAAGAAMARVACQSLVAAAAWGLALRLPAAKS